MEEYKYKYKILWSPVTNSFALLHDDNSHRKFFMYSLITDNAKVKKILIFFVTNELSDYQYLNFFSPVIFDHHLHMTALKI